jgi:hypothetical protein
MKRLKPQEVRVIRPQPSIMLNYTRQDGPASSTKNAGTKNRD